MNIQSSDRESAQSFLSKLYIPEGDSHKGQNGKIMIIGGSQLFHAAVLWTAEAASQIVDMVHFASTVENNEIFLRLKTVFRNGIVVAEKDIPAYLEEDDVILLGPGMVRSDQPLTIEDKSWEEIMAIPDEGTKAAYITHFILKNYPHKKIVLDAGALQMTDAQWLKGHEGNLVVTPHRYEFERLFHVSLGDATDETLGALVQAKAREYNIVIMLKTVTDIISDGTEIVYSRGGNQGLTKGGSGDILSGLTASFFTKSDGLSSAVLGSFILKSASDALFEKSGIWYNMTTILKTVPHILKKFIYNRT